MSETLQIHPEEEQQQKVEDLVEELEAIAVEAEAEDGLVSEQVRAEMLKKLHELGELALRQEAAPQN